MFLFLLKSVYNNVYKYSIQFNYATETTIIPRNGLKEYQNNISIGCNRNNISEKYEEVLKYS